MNANVFLRLTGSQKQILMNHLFPDDGMEAVAMLVCGRRRGQDRHCLSVFEVVPIPYADCIRTDTAITWPTSRIRSYLELVSNDGLALVKVHSHPGGYDKFSIQDDESDREFFQMLGSWTESFEPHGSVVVLPSGRMFGRFGLPDGEFCAMQQISVAGENIEYWPQTNLMEIPTFMDRTIQVLGEETIAALRQIRCAVVGCSGTGSPVIEQLYRLGIGELMLIDPDRMGPENLNRILNSRGRDADQRSLKVDVLADAIEDSGLGNWVTAIPKDMCDPEVIQTIATCDLIFGCVDSVFARHILNKISSTYNIPYVDVGVGVHADGVGGISQATIAVHYLEPDGSSLLSRNVYDLDDVQSEILMKTDPTEFADRHSAGYIKGAVVSSPAIISINMIAAGYGVFEFLCRLRQLRDEGNADFASQRWSLSGGFVSRSCNGIRCRVVTRNQGRGDMLPLLGMPELSIGQKVGGVYA